MRSALGSRAAAENLNDARIRAERGAVAVSPEATSGGSMMPPSPKLSEYYAVVGEQKRYNPQTGRVEGALPRYQGFWEWQEAERLRREEVQLRGTLLVAGGTLAMAAPYAAPLLVDTAGMSAFGATAFTSGVNVAANAGLEYGMTGEVTPAGVGLSFGAEAWAFRGAVNGLGSLEIQALGRAESESFSLASESAPLGLYRRRTNTGPFSALPELMTLKNVKRVASEYGVGLSGVRVRIVRDPKLIGSGLLGYAHPQGHMIDLYPEAFTSRETLGATLGHERTHVFQARTHGAIRDSSALMSRERAAYGTEYQWLDYATGAAVGSGRSEGTAFEIQPREFSWP
jgi:hypothetical protein